MLFLQMKRGEYLTIGEDIVIQAFPDSGSSLRLAITAPKEVTILRGEVLERNGEERPQCLLDPNVKKGKKGRTPQKVRDTFPERNLVSSG